MSQWLALNNAAYLPFLMPKRTLSLSCKNVGLLNSELKNRKFAFRCPEQGCQMVCFQTKNPNLGKFWRALDWKILAHFMFIWYIISGFGILCQEKSGNPGPEPDTLMSGMHSNNAELSRLGWDTCGFLTAN
jgi:hypothetical protein